MSEEVMEQAELLLTPEEQVAFVDELTGVGLEGIVYKTEYDINGLLKAQLAKAKQHYEQKGLREAELKGVKPLSRKSLMGKGLINSEKRLDRPELREKIKKLLTILSEYCTTDEAKLVPQFRENSRNGIADQILALLIPDTEMVTISLADMLLKAKREEKERIIALLDTKNSTELRKRWQALKEEK